MDGSCFLFFGSDAFSLGSFGVSLLEVFAFGFIWGYGLCLEGEVSVGEGRGGDGN